MTFPAKRPKAFPNQWEWVGVALLAVFLIRTFLIFSAFVPNHSLEPLLNKGEWVLSVSYQMIFKKPQKGDLVLVKDTRRAYQYFVKISAVPGDALIKDDQSQEELKVLKNGHYLISENKTGSTIDDHGFGPINIDQIKGKAIMVLWPIYSVRWIRSHV